MFYILLFFFLICINLGYWGWVCFTHWQSTKETLSNYDCTVLICCKNNADELQQLLTKIKNQRTPTTQILVINDYSNHSEEEKIHYLKTKYSFDLITPSQDIIGKKLAVFEGIHAAKYNNILLIDSDCNPHGEWLHRMNNALQSNGLTLGYSPIKKEKNLLNTWMRYENVVTALQYLSFAANGMPYMGVGRNMAITKAAVNNLLLEDLHIDIPSGDDDMLVQHIGKANICVHSEAFVTTNGLSTWREYIRQKRRHYGIATKYKLKHKVLLSIFSSTQMLLLPTLVFGLWVCPIIVCITVVIRWLIMIVLSSRKFKRLQQQDLLWYMPILDIALSLHYWIFSVVFLLPKDKAWQ